MQRKVLLLIVAIALIAAPAWASKLEKKADKIGYAIGMKMGGDFKRQKLDINPDMWKQGFEAAIAGKETALTAEEMKKVLQDLQTEMRTARQAEIKAKGAANLKAGKAFLAENAKKKGVKTTASGLQYQVLTEGKGKTPKADDKVKVNYRGTLIDGTEFDSSYKRGEPATFQANRVIKGWTEALQLMQEGAKYKLFIPSELAYGERAASAEITPNSTLVFEVELLEVLPQKAPKKEAKK